MRDDRVCSKCQTAKPATDFCRDRSRPDGLHPWCRGCRSFEASVRYERDRDRIAARNRAWKAANPGRVRATNLSQRFNLSADEYARLLAAQGGVCAVCGCPESATVRKTGTVRALAVDHDHRCCPGERTCGRCVRGLLCSRCNTLLGLAREDPALLGRATVYLDRAPRADSA